MYDKLVAELEHKSKSKEIAKPESQKAIKPPVSHDDDGE